MSRNYKFHNGSATYFVSFATVYWIDLFTREQYFNVLVNSVDYCRSQKGMELYAYCFMPSHVHLVFRSTQKDPMGLLRDFKKYTARKLLQAIREHPKESRREWMLDLFQKAGRQNKHITHFQFWQHHNKPIELWSMKVIRQKINYIHNNPVASGFVTDPMDWKYSSSRNFRHDHSIMQIDELGL